MPELPEVETVRAGLARLLPGATITGVRLGDYPATLDGITLEAFRAEVAGRRITSVERRAKYLLLRLEGGDAIAVHLRMTGELRVVPAGTTTGKHHRLALELDDERELRFNDVRKFGRVRLLRAADLAALHTTLGPEPLDPELTPETFGARLAGRRRPIKSLLLDQSFLAGIGNIYADEALFAARIHPLRPAGSLSEAEAERLLEAIRAALTDAIRHRGTTLRDYRDALGQAGDNRRYLRIYPLPEGAPCPRCGEPVRRLVVGQRGTKLCPHCQPL